MKTCKNCSVPLSTHQYVYCSNQCQRDLQYREYITAWKKGATDGIVGASTQTFSRHIKRYMFEKYENRCCQCGWNKINPKGTLPSLEVDHIDGDSTNNKEANLRLLCPNCHSLTPFYKNFNTGKGRTWRTEKYRKNPGRKNALGRY